ncbi:MAG: LysR family transcriptional regulator [Flavobacteriales bacterium]|nr:hypothetical protein [Flavobacteriales bacterium]MCC6578687.1 LysR family transcriptional regulator [Flavobacteriales bacterium]NUQ16458.1 LysR family transcriptional regulator [Flavobacteriales bacterium]
MPSKKNYTLKVRIWIDEDQGPFLGVGRAALLQKIGETGSITNAAKALRMSYRNAWQLVEDMNRRSALPLVEKIHGGAKGSGAVLTKEGARLVKAFATVQEEIRAHARKKISKLFPGQIG